MIGDGNSERLAIVIHTVKRHDQLSIRQVEIDLRAIDADRLDSQFYSVKCHSPNLIKQSKVRGIYRTAHRLLLKIELDIELDVAHVGGSIGSVVNAIRR